MRASRSFVVALALWAALAAWLLAHRPSNPISWDTFGYHLYLPATFIHHDPGISDEAWVRSAMEAYKSSGTLYQISELPNGRWVDKYPMGMAMLWSPFFFAGHLMAGIIGEPQDGFSEPYQWSLIIASLVYLLAGLLLVRKVLLAFFSEGIAMAVLLLIVLGTNYLHQALHGTGMPHIFLFTLGAGVLWHSLQWQRSGRRRDAIILGLLLGLMVVSRPSEAVWALVPMLIGLRDPRRWREHLSALWSKRGQVLLMTAVAVLVCLPQFIYWKWMTGKWLYMSYNNPGEGFEFLHPYTWEVLFSFRKGWYIYTPIMLVATLGIPALRRSVAELHWPVIIFFVLNLYIVSSWSCWWYADSFGQRALVQSYSLMALPLGAAIDWLAERRWLVRVAGWASMLALVSLNLFQFRQCEVGLIHSSRMTWAAYKAVFGRMSTAENLSSLLLVERSYTGDNGRPEPAEYAKIPMAILSFEDEPSDSTRIQRKAFSGSGSFLLGAWREFSPAWERPWGEITDGDHAWFEISCHVQRPADGSTPHLSLITTFEHKGESYAYNGKDVHLDETAPGAWVKVTTWYLSPEVRRPNDVFKAYCWLQDTLPVQIDEMSITLFEQNGER